MAAFGWGSISPTEATSPRSMPFWAPMDRPSGEPPEGSCSVLLQGLIRFRGHSSPKFGAPQRGGLAFSSE